MGEECSHLCNLNWPNHLSDFAHIVCLNLIYHFRYHLLNNSEGGEMGVNTRRALP